MYHITYTPGVLRDEFTTLQLMCKKLEEDNKNLMMENQHMLEKILLHKKEEVDVINMHNETMKKLVSLMINLIINLV